YELLHINPGAAGKSGFHNIRTAVRFTINGNDMKDLEILEVDRNL
ncbi:MAG: YfcE family phosphodiesterase, partial [Bacteroidales bacterium]|nr:YfcE family phosphodiesterase [Bacteroidales bacterium]